MIRHLAPAAAAVCLAAGMAAAGGNLNQYHDFAGIQGRPNTFLFAYFRALDGPPASLERGIADIIMNASSKRLRLACREMVNMWGTDMRGTAQMIPRVVTRLHTDRLQFLLTFTCFSTNAAIDARYNDQRVALLTVDSAMSIIAVIPHGDTCGRCTDLSQIQALEEVTIGGKPGVRMELTTSSDNPCCGGSDGFDERRVVYYVVDGHDLRMAASVLVERDAVSGNDEEGDSVASYRADLVQHLDSTRSLTGFDVAAVLTEDSVRVSRRQFRYLWQADSLRFVADTLR